MRKALVTASALASLAVLLGLTMILASVVNRVLTARMDELKSRSIEAIQALVGHRITYQSISPSFLSCLEVRDLVVHDAIDTDRPLLTIHRVRIYYNLLHLLARRDPVGSLREIQILNSRFSLDLQRDQAVIALLERLTQAGGGAGGLRARITGANVGISVQAGDAAFTLTDLFFTVDAGRDALAVSLRGACRGSLPSGFTFASTIGAEGRIDRSFTWSDLTMRLLSFDSSIFSLGRQTLQVVWKGSRIQVHKIQDHSPIDLGITADLDRQDITLDFQADGLRPDKLVLLSGPFARFNPWLSAPLTAVGKLTYSLKDRHAAYSGGITASFADQLPIHDVTLESTFRGTETGASFSPIRIASPVGTLEFDGDLRFDDMYPQGMLTLVNVDDGSGRKVSANLSIERRNGSLFVQGRHLAVGQVGLDDFSLSLAPGEKGTGFNLASSFAGLPDSRISATGELRLGQTLRSAVSGRAPPAAAPPALALSAVLSNVPSDRLYRLAMGAGRLTPDQQDIASLLSGSTMTASFDLSTDLSGVAISNGRVSIRDKEDPSTSVRFLLDLDATRVSVSALQGTFKGYPVEGALSASAKEGQVSFTTDFKLQGTPFSLAGRYSDALGLSATGTYGVDIKVLPNRDGTYSVQARGRKLPVPVSGSGIRLSFDLNGLFSSPQEWVIQAPSLIVYDVPFLESKQNAVELSGRLTPRRLTVDRIIFTDSYSTLKGTAEAALSLPSDPLAPGAIQQISARFSASLAADGGGAAAGGAAAGNAAGSAAARSAETYSMRGTLSGGDIAASIAFTRVPLGRLRALSLRGSLSGTGEVTGPLGRPVVSLAVSLKDGLLGGDPLAADAQVRLAPGQVQVSALKVDYLAHHLSGGTGYVDLAKGEYGLQVSYAGEYFLDRVGLNARLEGRYDPRAVAPGAPGLLEHGLQGRLSVSDVQVQNKPFPGWDVVFQGQRGRLTFDGGPANAIHGSIDSHLAFAFHLSNPLPLIGDAGGRITGDSIVANATFVKADVTVLNSILKAPQVPTIGGTAPVILFTSGIAAGRLAFSGPFADPDCTGELAVVGGGMRSAYAADEMGPVTTRFIFDGKGFHTPREIVNAGPTRLSVQASFTIDHWAPSAFDLSFETVDPTSAHLRVHFGRMIADGHVVGSMRITGDDSRTNVTGSLRVTDCRITLGQNEVPKFVPEEVPTFLTLNVQTGKRVEFAWPSENYPVIRTTASPGGKVAITYRGDTGVYTVKGSTGIQGGEVYYFERSFILKKGTIVFNEDQSSFDPRITARAELREWDPSSGEEMRIFLDADSPLSKFTPRFSSDPPRSDQYIMAMIGAPFVARAETQGLGISAALMSSDVISQTWLLRPLEQRLRDILKLDMVSVRTQIIQNLLVQKLFGTTLNPLDNTSVSLGKYLGNDLFLEMLVRLQTPTVTGYVAPAGLPPSPVPTLPSAGIGLVPQLELNMEWTTPFFLLDWSFQPQHPETMFLTDQSLTFSWRFSY